MKNKLTIGFIWLLGATPVGAGFHLGLGGAVADEGTKIFTKAAEADQQADTGDNVARSLPSCGNDTPYTVSPMAITEIQGLDPLGHVNPPGHTLPSDHIYFYIVSADTNTPFGTRVITNVIAPGNIHVTNISFAYTNGNPATTDYGLQFYACREVKSYFLHLKTLSSTLSTALNNSNPSCSDYTTGGSSFHRCAANTNIPIPVGDVIGTAGGNAAAFDFGTYDYRRTPLAFISPAKHYSDQIFTVCPLDYFEPGVKASLEGHLGRWDGALLRTTPPLCGEILYDVTGAAMGDWFHVGSPDSPEDPHLALIKDNVYNPRQVISVGTSVPGVGPMFYPFDPFGSGTHNRDFAQVTSDGQVYCYDTFFDPVGQPAFASFSILITMPTPTSIRVGKFNSASCGAGPWTLGSYGEFQR